jgi:hypothetical protein
MSCGFPLRPPSGQARERHRFRNPRKIAAGRYFLIDELVQWMVQDASVLR